MTSLRWKNPVEPLGFQCQVIHSNQPTSSTARNSLMKQSKITDLSFLRAAHCGQDLVVRIQLEKSLVVRAGRHAVAPAPGTTIGGKSYNSNVPIAPMSRDQGKREGSGKMQAA